VRFRPYHKSTACWDALLHSHGSDAFRVEVADLIKSGEDASEKETGIQQMLSWFESAQGGQKPSRSAVSEKLTPYYRRFFSDRH
jgi:hypothetical protein